MAEKQRMTGEEVVRWLMADDGADPVRESLKWMAQELMEAEVSGLVGAELGERTEDRATHRNGYRPRRWDTRAGELELAIPKLRRGSYFPSFLQPRKRAEQALVAVVQEAYVAGVSTRKVDQVVESLGLRVSKSEVSRICAGLDEQVEAFRSRPLEGRYPYLFLDAKVEKVRDGGRVVRKCVVIAHGVHESGRREVIGLDVGEAETEAFWREFLRGLVARGLIGVQLAISDAHPGLKAAIAQVMGCAWQRCTVHFLRDMLGHVAKAQQAVDRHGDPPGLRRRLGRRGFRAPGGGGGAPRGPGAEGGPPARGGPSPTSWPSSPSPASTGSKLRSTNPLERVNREIGRGSDVVGIFPNDAALIRLAPARARARPWRRATGRDVVPREGARGRPRLDRRGPGTAARPDPSTCRRRRAARRGGRPCGSTLR